MLASARPRMPSTDPSPSPSASHRTTAPPPGVRGVDRIGIAALLGLALWANLPALAQGFYTDDFVLLAALAGEAGVTGRTGSCLDLFDFASGPGPVLAGRVEHGAYPWWTDPELSLRFGRPLAALTHRLDHRLFGARPFPLHAHSLLWALAAGLAATLAYGRIFGPGALARSAGALFVLAPAGTVLVGWVAGRNALMGLAFGAAALAAHASWRTRGGPGRLLASLACLGCGLAANEGTAAVLAFVLAFGLHLDPAGPGPGARAALPHALLVATWWTAYRLAGFGAAASGSYLSPEPGRPEFWIELARRFVLVLASASGLGLPIDVVEHSPPAWNLALIGLGTLLLAAVTALVAGVARRDPGVAFWGTALLLATPFACLGMPSERALGLTLLAGPGFAVAFAHAVWFGDPGAGTTLTRLRRGLALLLLARTAVVNPLLRPTYRRALEDSARPVYDVCAEGLLASRDLSDVRLVVLSPPGPNEVSFLPPVLRTLGRAAPDRIRIFLTGQVEQTITRTGPRTFVVETGGRIFDSPFSRIYRARSRPLVAGQAVALSDVRYRVDRLAPDGSPTRVTVEFDGDPESPRYLWVRWERAGLRPFPVPRPGESVRLEAGFAPSFFLGSDGLAGDLLGLLGATP